MTLADRRVLATRFAGAALTLARDAIADGFGRALPLAPEVLTDPDRLAELAGRGAPVGSHALGRPAAATLTPHEAPSSNCRNSVLSLDWGGGTGPTSVFVKQPSADLPTRLFANVIGFWKTEAAVARHLAHRLPVRTPHVHAVLERGGRFVLLLENLAERPGVRLFVNRDLLAGADPSTAEGCLRTLARLHSGMAETGAADREAWLPERLHPFRSSSLRPVNLAVNREAIARCQARAPGVFDGGCAALYRRALARWPVLESAWYAGAPTLVHGDSHLGNFFQDGDEMGMLDFQGAHWGRGIRDVQYFLTFSVPSEKLARSEKALVAFYLEEVARAGGESPVDFEAAWEEYRGFSFQSLMTAVVSLGLGSFTDSDDVIRCMLERSVASVHRLQFGAWLDARP